MSRAAWRAIEGELAWVPETGMGSAFPGPGATIQISNQGGRLPMWSRNGRELFYVEPSPRRLMAVDLSRGPTQPGVPQFLFTIRSDQGNVYYDVAPDTKRFLVLLPSQGESSSPSQTKFMVVSEWFQELLRRAPLKK